MVFPYSGHYFNTIYGSITNQIVGGVIQQVAAGNGAGRTVLPLGALPHLLRGNAVDQVQRRDTTTIGTGQGQRSTAAVAR